MTAPAAVVDVAPPTAPTVPADFDDFWSTTLEEARAFDLDVVVTPVDTRLTTLDVFDLTYSGFGGHRIHAWLRVPRSGPASGTGLLPGVVHFTGYGAGRGAPTDDLVLASAGYAHLLMDTRGQGIGDTGDPGEGGPGATEFVIRGIQDPRSYYYRRVYVDAVRAVDALASLEGVDASRLAAVGNSQGGGIALAVAGLVPELRGVLSQAPFLADFPRIAGLSTSPSAVLGDYLASHPGDADEALATLAYFDGVHLASRAQAPAWFSIGLLDDVVAPRSVFSAYDAYAGPKRIRRWPQNGHEAGGVDDVALALRILDGLLAPGDSPHTDTYEEEGS